MQGMAKVNRKGWIAVATRHDIQWRPTLIHPLVDPVALLKGLIRHGSPYPLLHPNCLIPCVHSEPGYDEVRRQMRVFPRLQAPAEPEIEIWSQLSLLVVLVSHLLWNARTRRPHSHYYDHGPCLAQNDSNCSCRTVAPLSTPEGGMIPSNIFGVLHGRALVLSRDVRLSPINLPTLN
jgi:hypothetical protein